MNLHTPWMLQSVGCDRKTLTQCFLAFVISSLFFLLSLSHCYSDVRVPEGCRQTTDLYHHLPPFFFFLVLFPSLLIPLYLRAMVQHYDRIWRIWDDACIPTPEYQTVGRGELCQRKKMTCGTGRYSWIDQINCSGAGDLEREGNCEESEELDTSFEKLMWKKYQSICAHFHSQRHCLPILNQEQSSPSQEDYGQLVHTLHPEQVRRTFD